MRSCKRPETVGFGITENTFCLSNVQHSMGSEAGYSLKATDAPRAVVGRGSIHMEANYGESFPTGWVWAQVRDELLHTTTKASAVFS